MSSATIFAQKTTEDYKTAATKSGANYYTIVSETRAEFATKDLTILANKKAKKQFERWAYQWENKIGLDGTFPDENTGYFNAGILDTKGKLVVGTTPSKSSDVSAAQWTNVGPKQSDVNNNGYSNYPQMGRLNAFLRIKHPTDINLDVLFVGAPGGGIWKSTDGGANWTPKLDMVAGIGVTDIKTVPGTTTANYTTQPIYVSTGDADGGNVKSIGVLKSTDGGETFSSTGLSYTIGQQKFTGDLVVFDANNVLVGEMDRIKRTTDGGVTWTDAHNAESDASVSRAANNGNEIMYTGAYDLYYTSNYTTNTWVTIIGTDPNKRAVTVDDNGNFYIQNQDGQVQLYNKTSNTLSNVGSIPVGYNSQEGFNQALIVNNDIMISGDFNGSSSTDNGTNWYRSLNGYWNDASSDGTYIHSDHHRMGELDSNLNLWSVNDGGLSYITYSTASDNKPTITYKSGNVIVTQSYSVAINSNADDSAFVISNQDNDAFSKTNGQWYAVAAGDGIQSAINYNNTMIRYSGNQGGSIEQTGTGFIGELNGNGNVVTIPGANFYYPFEMHKTDPNIMFGGGSTDVHILNASTGLTITPANSGLTGGTVTSIATHDNFVFATTATDFKTSTDSGATWSSFAIPNAGGAGSGGITSIDMKNAGGGGGVTMYATRGGYSTTNKVQRLFVNWEDITGNLPNIVVNEIMVKQNSATEYLFLATELGVYYTDSPSGATTNWTKLGQGLPNVNVKDIEIHYTADKLIAGTFGRGLWEIDISNAVLSTTDLENELAGISVYPNPAVNSINVKLPNNNDYKYIIYNAVGGVVKSGKLNTNIAIDVSNLAKSLYMIRIYSDTSSITKKIILK